MKKESGKKLSKKKLGFIIGGAAVVLLLIAVLFVRGASARRTAMAAAGAQQTIALKKTDLTQAINISGVVESAETTNIYSTLSYPVKEIFVEEGDSVEAGDVIAVLDTANLENDVAQAEINYNSAVTGYKDSVTNAQNSLNAAKISAEQRAMAVTNAEKDLNTARTDAAKPFDSTIYDRAVTDTRITLERKRSDSVTATNEYNKALGNFDDYRYKNAIADATAALDSRKTALDTANINYLRAQADFNTAYFQGYASTAVRDTAMTAAQTTLDAAQKAYDSAVSAAADAQTALDRAKTDLTRAKSDAIKAAADKADAANNAQTDAQRAYDKAVKDKSRAASDSKDANQTKVETAEKALADAKKQLESAQNSLKNAENALSQTKAEQGNAGKAVELQGLTLEKLERQLAEGQIIAEASGVITAVNATVGAPPQGALFVIDNKDDLYVSAKVKEYNLNSLAIGQEIQVTTDATGGKKLNAVLSHISPKAVSAAGSTSVEFEIRATITDPDEAIKIGMNAFLNIVTDSKQGVYAAPISAVVTNEKGSFVYAMSGAPAGGNRQPRARAAGSKPAETRQEIKVTLGLKTSTSVEISGDGLKDGLLLLTDPQNKLSEGSQGMPGMMFGRGR